MVRGNSQEIHVYWWHVSTPWETGRLFDGVAGVRECLAEPGLIDNRAVESDARSRVVSADAFDALRLAQFGLDVRNELPRSKLSHERALLSRERRRASSARPNNYPLTPRERP